MNRHIKIHSHTHTLLIAVYPVLLLYSNNIEHVLFSDIIVPVAVQLILAILSIIIFNFVFKDKVKGLIFATLLFFFTFLYGYFHIELKTFFNNYNYLIRHREFLLYWTLLLIFICVLIFKYDKHIKIINTFLNVFATILILFTLVAILDYKFKDTSSNKRSNLLFNETFEIRDVDRYGVKPNIYYIVLDRYANSTILKDNFNYDNSEVIDYLNNKGFYIADKSTSNYPITAHSLASSLNLNYLDKLLYDIPVRSDDWNPIYNLIKNSKAIRILKSIGYEYIHIGSWWAPTKINKHADQNFNNNKINEFSRNFISQTIFYPILVSLNIYENLDEIHMKSAIYAFDKLFKLSEIKQSTFIFAHILMPHAPYVFNKDCEFIQVNWKDNKESKTHYINQLECTNKLLMQTIENIIEYSKVRPIIIIQSDEGPYPDKYNFGIDFKDWTIASQEELRHKMRIFNAYYLPDSDETSLYDSITPVNTFRLIISSIINSKIDLVPDLNYVYQNDNNLYKYIDVTEKVRF